MSDPKCGTTAGYQAHRYRHTPTCQPCKDAQADWQRHYRTRVYLAKGRMVVDATGTHRRIKALARIGWSLGALGGRLGLSPSTLGKVLRHRFVQRSTAEKVARLYDELWDTPGTSATARTRATSKGWLPPLAFDDETIDDPAARPAGSVRGVPFDDIAVERAMHGDDVYLRPVERREVVRRLTAQGFSAAQIAARLRVDKRSVQRLREAS